MLWGVLTQSLFSIDKRHFDKVCLFAYNRDAAGK